MQLDLFPRPAYLCEPPATSIENAEFKFGGRGLRVVRTYGEDDAAPVVVEELSGKFTLPGQYALWSRNGVAKELER